VTFDKVRVPVSNTLGKVGKGMQVILSNFNHEVILSNIAPLSSTNMVFQRWMIAACALGMQRLVVEECLKYVNYCRVLILFLIPDKVVESAYCVRKTSTCPSRRQGQVGWNDFSR
jgi:alkylation response protein AidB-like acyl-CoA dehydrogenase